MKWETKRKKKKPTFCSTLFPGKIKPRDTPLFLPPPPPIRTKSSVKTIKTERGRVAKGESTKREKKTGARRGEMGQTQANQ